MIFNLTIFKLIIGLVAKFSVSPIFYIIPTNWGVGIGVRTSLAKVLPSLPRRSAHAYAGRSHTK